ncbi:hypothetical protein Acr_06g0000990 [Actinidia rufa]|uniref:Uncharacterized protein n=1 Tax=Actinidia rufa TaxID=165716 RepID=A0A7J0EQ67_9ERIC|nr:hypothetical protein Acr_06g0000990 [Actinidia rufa]
MQMLSLMEPKEGTPLALAPWLSDDDLLEARNLDSFYGCRENEFDEILDGIVSETSLGGIIFELGYGCTLDASHCNEVLSLFLPLTEATISRLLGTIARTYTGLEDNQNCCSTFYCAVGSSATLESTCLGFRNVDVLMDSINQLAPNTNWTLVMENLDHEGFYIPSEQYVVSAPTEIFTFAYSARKLGYANELSAKETPYNLLQYERFSTVFSIIVGDANGCGIILQLWQSNPKLVLQGFIDMMTTNYGNIVIVINISQELKVKSLTMSLCCNGQMWTRTRTQTRPTQPMNLNMLKGSGKSLKKQPVITSARVSGRAKFEASGQQVHAKDQERHKVPSCESAR